MNNLDDHLPKELAVFNMDSLDFNSRNNSDRSTKVDAGDGNDLTGVETARASSNDGQEPHNKGEKSMADELNKEALAQEVEAILAKKDAAKQVEARIASLESEKASLADELAKLTEAKDTLSSELDTAKAELDSKTQECEALARQKEESEAKASEMQVELDNIRAEQSLAKRVSELTEASVLMPEGEKREKQMAKVKAMSDEDFSSYLEDLVEIQGLAKATAPAGEPAADDQSTQEPKGEPAQATAALLPPDTSDGAKFNQTVAAAQVPVNLDDDQVSAYANM